MSVQIESLDELLTLVKKLNLKVTNVEELRSVLTTVNASYNPDAARTRVARLIAVIVPSVLGGAAGIATMMLMDNVHKRGPLTETDVGALGVIWGVAGLVTLLTLGLSLLLLCFRRPAAVPPPPAPVAGRPFPTSTAITDQPAGVAVVREIT